MKYEESEGFRHTLTYPLAVNELYNRCCTVGSNGKEKELVGRFLKCYVKAEVIGLEIDLSPGVICIALLPEPPAPVLSPSLHTFILYHLRILFVSISEPPRYRVLTSFVKAPLDPFLQCSRVN